MTRFDSFEDGQFATLGKNYSSPKSAPFKRRDDIPPGLRDVGEKIGFPAE
jgi:hypothetical protein